MKPDASDFDLQKALADWRKLADQALSQALDAIAVTPGCPAKLAEAMRYAVLGGGKRLRPALCLAACRACGGDASKALDGAVAVEFVHAYSLVHDDLPAMDDDDFRRGRPTCHKAFGEALAILAGDALLTHAFEFAARIQPAHRSVSLLAQAAGAAGMVGGQVDDVDGQAMSLEEVESVHRRKTACMMEASVGLGALAANADAKQIEALTNYATALGLAFQIADDVLAHDGDASELGRPTDSDQKQDRRTHPRLVGLEASRERVAECIDEALESLRALGPEALPLRALATFVARRAEGSIDD